MRICCATSGLSSMLSLTMRTAPLAARTAFSRIGPSCLQGPHHGAQKSTTTGCSNDASTTSAIKVSVVTSLIGAAAAAPLPAPPPIITSSAIPASLPGFADNMATPERDDKRRGAPPSILALRDIDNARWVAAGIEKADEIAGRDRGGAVVFERVIIERVVIEHRALQHDGDASVAVIDRGERGDAPRPHAEHLLEKLGRPKRETRRVKHVGELLQIDPAFLECDDEPEPALLVLQEKALAMPARQGAAQRLGLLHRKDRRVGVGAVGDTELVKPGEKHVGRELHG